MALQRAATNAYGDTYPEAYYVVESVEVHFPLRSAGIVLAGYRDAKACLAGAQPFERVGLAVTGEQFDATIPAVLSAVQTLYDLAAKDARLVGAVNVADVAKEEKSERGDEAAGDAEPGAPGDASGVLSEEATDRSSLEGAAAVAR